MSRAWPSTPAADASWSMIPDGTPLARCSARWQAWASSSEVPSNPRASATATSRAALDDSPPPIGSVVDTVPSKPRSGLTSATTPATYRAQPGSMVRGSSTSIGTTAGSASSAERRTTASPPRSPSTVVPRSIAIGRTSPPR